MIAETPYSILAVRDSEAAFEILNILMPNGSFEQTCFTALHETLNFHKVLCDESLGKSLIDWKDNLKIDEFLISNIK